jgi:HAD superfamily hydrolase (TIGR01549 family)
VRGRQTGVVTIDLWHTLVDLPPFAEGEYMRRQWALGGDSVAESPPGPLAADVNAPLDPWAAFRRAYDEAVAAGREGSTRTSEEQVRRAGELAGRRVRPGAYLRRLERLVGETQFRLVPDAKAMVEALRLGGYRLGLISNTIGEPGRLFVPHLARFGLSPSFDVFVWSDEHPWTKPSQQIFRYALERLRAPPSDAVHVGDGASDILGAQSVGYRATILFEGSGDYDPEYRERFAPQPGATLNPTHRARRLKEIPALVDRELRDPRTAP